MEATKFTEVGFVGGDVEQIIKDLVDNALNVTRKKLDAKHEQEVCPPLPATPLPDQVWLRTRFEV